MAKLLTITHAEFKKEMDANFSEDQNITSLDIFDTFVAALEKDTNVLDSEALKALVFNQFKTYGDFDKTMNEVAQKLSEIHTSTGDAIKAIDGKDTGGLKDAYSKLKAYQQRINELEQDVYSDDLTGAYNRKYLMSQELDKDENFKSDGHLMHIKINNFLDINREHGHESGDAVLRLISKSLQKRLRPMGVHLIRYLGVQFVVLAKPTVSKKVEVIFDDTVNTILEQKFKAHSGKVFSIDIQFEHQAYSKGQNFKQICEGFE
ncbi:GGDEF domain-containing protein [Campylobacterota bacterium]